MRDPRPGEADWAEIRERVRAHGLRWTPQRRLILEELSQLAGG